ncbi:putative thiol methyltransferase 2 [Hypsizygus marmoreus]|uniref:Thiol methyltransferase 2 n=1 Tax=Hypsizygus marmoreus TaxID=39966 RepID=A0A369J3F2_HYPMA|nr:putative thiol methyltransferase 2 [Hypsizygus marmoreus]
MSVDTTSVDQALRELIKADDPSSWDNAWKADITPWEAGDVQPPLRELIESGEVDFPQHGRALVPGCGSGNDVLYIASSLNLETMGIDVAPTAIEKAQENVASKHGAFGGNVKFDESDFFMLEVTSDAEKFDLIYDYTFFVAIPPSKRPEWGQQMSMLIKPGGYLVALVFPLNPPNHPPVGPPFFVRVEHYADVLGSAFVKVLDKEPGTSLPRHRGKEKIVVWRRV